MPAPSPLPQPSPALSIRKLLVVLALLALLPLGLDFLFEAYVGARARFEHANERSLQLTRSAAADTERFLKQSDALLAALAGRPLVRAMDAANCDALMLQLPALSQRYEVPSTLDLNGRFVCHGIPLGSQPATPGKEILERLERMRARPGFTIGHLKQGVLTGNWIVPLSRPVLDDAGHLKGMINLTVNLKRFDALMAGAPVPPGFALALVDGEGRVLTGSGGMERFVGRDHGATPLGRELAPGREGTARSTGLDGEERLFAFTPVAGSNWMVVGGTPAASIDGEARRTQAVHLALGVTLLSLVGGILYLLYRRIEHPIASLLAATRAVAEGNTAVRVDAREIAEFAEVGAAFNTMLDALDRQRGAVEESRRQLETVLASVEEVIYSWSPREERIHFVSNAFEEMFGVTPEELEQDPRRWLQAVHPEDRERVGLALERLCQAGVPFNQEYRVQLPDGRIAWVHDRARATLDADGQVTRVDGMAIDHTPYRQAEQLIRESESRLAGIIGTAMDGVIMIDERHRVTLFNPAAERMFGYEASEVIGQSVDLLIPEHARPAHDAQIRDFGDRGVPQHRLLGPGRVHGLRRNGEVFPLDASISRMQVAGRRYFTAILRDRTEQEQHEDAIRTLNERLEHRVRERTAELERAMRELESFSYSISHDLRAPLRAINGFAHILQETEPLGRDGKGLLARIMKNSEKMGELIDDVLAFSRVTRAELTPSEVPMAAQAAAVAAELREHTPADIHIGDLPSCQGDATMLRQVWANLIGNALKFSSRAASPRVEVSAETRELDGREQVVYSVRDNGVGFDMQYTGRLFGVFQRMHAAEQFPGTGVGLAIVKQIVERHHGRIWAEAAPGQGATFHFTIGPLSPTEGAPIRSGQPQEADQPE